MKRVLAIIILFTGLIFIENIMYKKSVPLHHEELLYFPKDKTVKVAAGGFSNFIADLMWIKAVEYFGGHRLTDRQYPYLYNILDVLTTLDRYFVPAYTLGGVLLVADAKDTTDGLKLLKKGLYQIPERWEIPFTIGIVYFLYLHDCKNAARWFYVAGRYHDTYPGCVSLASYCLERGYSPEKGIELWEKIYNSGNRLWKQKAIEGISVILRYACIKYKKKYGEFPKNLEFLVKKGILKRLPHISGVYFTCNGKEVIVHGKG